VETEAEQAVEACDVIHMGVRDEHMAYPQQLSGGEAPDIA
jgi:ABC-type polar amino acid transport system ATPase subunit